MRTDEVFAPTMLVVLQIALLEGLLEQVLPQAALHANMCLGGIKMGGLELGGEMKIC